VGQSLKGSGPVSGGRGDELKFVEHEKAARHRAAKTAAITRTIEFTIKMLFL